MSENKLEKWSIRNSFDTEMTVIETLEGNDPLAVYAMKADLTTNRVRQMGYRAIKLASVEGRVVAKTFTRTTVTTVEAFQITEGVAAKHLVDKEPLPFGVTLTGGYNKDTRKVSSVRAYGDGIHAAVIGDWIVKGVSGNLHAKSDEDFRKEYSE